MVSTGMGDERMNVSGGDKAARGVAVVEEELHVGTEEVTTETLRVRTVVCEDEHVIDEPVRNKRVEIARVPVDRICDQPIPDQQEGDTTVLSLCREIITIQKKYQVYEEVHIRTFYEEDRHREVVRTRRTEAIIDRE